MRSPLVRDKTAWPPRLQLPRTNQSLIQLEAVPSLSTNCLLTTAFSAPDLQELFQSGQDIPCTDFDIVDLSAPLREELAQCNICPLQQLSDLDHYDRLLIFTDGSSKPAMRRMVPEHADELGHPDTWSMIVEKFMPKPALL